jgi:hypothetical protein
MKAILVGHPYSQLFPFDEILHLLISTRFDTIKVRLQTTEKAQFKGPLECLLQTIRHEGVRGLYKGATPPLVGWVFMDSVYGALAFTGFFKQG